MGVFDELGRSEVYWRDHYEWFKEQGFELRARYKPGWIPSWKTDPTLKPGLSEDSEMFNRSHLNDATRIADGKHVVLKRIEKSQYPEEVSILRYFSEKPLASNPENHCVPVLAVLNPPDDPEHDIAVLPILRDYDDPPFETIGEVVDYIGQILEGFVFLHEHRVAHRDVRRDNIMMDPHAMGHSSWHFVCPEKTRDYRSEVTHKYTRTERRPRYYIIDFGYSAQFKPEEMPPSTLPKPASDTSLPEYNNLWKPCDPFPIDVYVVGNMIRMDFLDGYPKEGFLSYRHCEKMPSTKRLEFLRPLIDAMIKENPNERVTMKEAFSLFNDIVSKVGNSTLRRRPDVLGGLPRHEWFYERIANTASHWYKTMRCVICRIPPIPRERTAP